jgi:hypothetical protein
MAELLRDLVSIPDEVHAGDFVLALAKGVGEESTITDYVVTELVLDEARRAGRPVILTADHGHVLDRGRPIHPAESEAARYRGCRVPRPGSAPARWSPPERKSPARSVR